MKTLLKTLALGAGLVCAVPAIAATYTGYVAFGDSLTDDGKLGLPLPYAGGRFSTGPTWAEFIAERFEDRGLFNANVALGGATAGDSNINSNGIDTPLDPEYPAAAQPFATFNRQISTIAAALTSPLSGSNPLVSVLFGANDIFQGGSPVDAANAVADGIERLVGLSAKLDDFLVSTLPELGDAPGDGGLTLAGLFNQTLADRLDLIGATGVNIIPVDQNAFQADLFPRLGDLGITNLAGPCLVSPTETSPGFDCTITGIDGDGSVIRDLSIANTYYLIDDVHPTGPVQREFGAFAIAALGDDLPPPVPLPAGLPLLLAGFGGFALLKYRRARTV